jgi:hypothetical protein
MKSFAFVDEQSGRQFWVSMPRSEYDDIVKNGGRLVTKSKLTGEDVVSIACQVADENRFTAICGVGTYPMVSDSMGTNPWQAAEFNDAARAAGITGVFYDSNGDCHLSCRTARRDWARFRGLGDNNGGYSDP